MTEDETGIQDDASPEGTEVPADTVESGGEDVQPASQSTESDDE